MKLSDLLDVVPRYVHLMIMEDGDLLLNSYVGEVPSCFHNRGIFEILPVDGLHLVVELAID